LLLLLFGGLLIDITTNTNETNLFKVQCHQIVKLYHKKEARIFPSRPRIN